MALLILCHASERAHFLNWVDGNHCCFLYRMFPVLLPGVSCLSLQLTSYFFHNVSLLFLTEYFLTTGPHCIQGSGCTCKGTRSRPSPQVVSTMFCHGGAVTHPLHLFFFVRRTCVGGRRSRSSAFPGRILHARVEVIIPNTSKFYVRLNFRLK